MTGGSPYSDSTCGADSTTMARDFLGSDLPPSDLPSSRSTGRWRSSNSPKIILPAVVCKTEVTAMSTFLHDQLARVFHHHSAVVQIGHAGWQKHTNSSPYLLLAGGSRAKNPSFIPATFLYTLCLISSNIPLP